MTILEFLGLHALLEIICHILLLPLYAVGWIIGEITGTNKIVRLEKFANKLGNRSISEKSDLSEISEGVEFGTKFENNSLELVATVTYQDKEVIVSQTKFLQTAGFHSAKIAKEYSWGVAKGIFNKLK